MMTMTTKQLSGFGNYFQSEAVAGVIQAGKNSPQQVPYGLYAEQLSGTAFTAPRHENLHSWLYRIIPSVKHAQFQLRPHKYLQGPPFTSQYTPPMQMRWDPLPFPNRPTNFVDSIITFCGNGSITTQQGAAIHGYACNADMTCLLYTSPSPRDRQKSRMPSSA